MIEFWQMLTSVPMLPATILLGGLLVYWALMLLAGLDLDLFEFDLDLDADGTAEGVLDWGGAALKLLNIGKVPIMFWISSLVFSFALVCFLDSQRSEPELWTPMLMMWARDLAIAIVITKLVTQPLRGRFIEPPKKVPEDRIGHFARVTTLEVTETFGEAHYTDDSPSLLIDIRSDESGITKEDMVEIIAWSPELRAYHVRKIEADSDG